jgi:O-antigen/teichoic acid export membrane protein
MKQERNMLIYFLGKMVPATAVLFVMVFGVRFLGKAEFGRYNLLFNCINISVTFFAGWIQQSMLRFNAGTEEILIHDRMQFIRYAVVSSLLCAAVIFLFTVFYFHETAVNSLVTGVFAFALSQLTVHLTYQQSRFRTERYVITESLYYIVAVLALSIVMFFSMPKQMISFYCAWLIAGMSWMIAESAMDGKAVVESLKIKTDQAFLKKTFQFGFLITGWLMISSLFNVADRFIIRHYFDFEKVGVYSVVYDLIYRITAFVSMPVLLTLHPLIMKMWNESRQQDAMALIRKAVLLLGLLLVAEITGYLILGNWLFETLFHLDTPGLMPLMIPLIISSVLWQAALFLHKPMEIFFKQRQMIAGILISLASNIILNFIFVPRYGFQAAAYTTLASTLVYIAFVLIMTGSYKKIAA